MTKNKTVWASSLLAIIVIAVGYWWFTSSQYVDALVSPQSDTSGAVTSQDGVTGATRQTDNPVMRPFGDTAGPVVDARSMTVAQVVANLDATEFASL